MEKPSRARPIGGDVEAEVLAMPASLPGVLPPEWLCLLFPDGEVKFYKRDAVEITKWAPSSDEQPIPGSDP